ncbi:MAG: hypothetical protein Ct9H300mP11_30550 [Chloroflexota bacterium]|nr:MAG: hypothetical protein Ct9H300mP11_30550 [Chloroflexota bacterium]
MALFSIATVGYSFVNNRRPLPKENSAYSDDNDQDLAGIFDAISTLDLEFQLGRLPQEQFQEQFQAYRLQAGTVLRDKLEAGPATQLGCWNKRYYWPDSSRKTRENGSSPVPTAAPPY